MNKSDQGEEKEEINKKPQDPEQFFSQRLDIKKINIQKNRDK